MKYLVLGYFGYRTNQLDGQTVKTRDLFRLLEENIGKEKVDYFDTQDFRYGISNIFVMFKKIIMCRYLFYLPAHNNLKYIFPVIFVFSKIFRFKIFYFIIGGWLVEYLSTKPLHRWMLKRTTGIFSETKLMEESLEEKYEFRNVSVFPNFRFTSFVPTAHHEMGKLKLVFLARINKMKGLDVIFSLASCIQNKGLQDRISIDFFGPVYDKDRMYFFEELRKYSFLSYKGELQPSDINITIEKYDVMLLPTHYFTEGLPGSVLDAYMSGIPIIVSKWKHAEEFVVNGKTGFIIPFENGIQELENIIDLLYNNPDLLSKMKNNAYKESNKYSSRYAWDVIKDYADRKSRIL